MITPAEVDALQFGDVVRIDLSAEEPIEGPVENRNGCKVVGDRWLTHKFPVGEEMVSYTYMYEGQGQWLPVEHRQVSTGYGEYLLRNGTLTVLQRCHGGTA